MKKSPQNIGFLLQEHLVKQKNQFTYLTEKAELLYQLNAQLQQLVPAYLVGAFKVANLRDDILVLETASSAWAQRLNFQKSALLLQLQTEVLPMLTGIEVKVNPQLNKRDLQQQVDMPKLTRSAAEHLQALAAQTDGELQQKLKRLAEKASRS